MSARPVEVVDFVDPSRVGGVKRAREEGAAPRAPPSAPPLAPLPAGLSRKHHPTDRRSVFASVAALGASGFAGAQLKKWEGGQLAAVGGVVSARAQKMPFRQFLGVARARAFREAKAEEEARQSGVVRPRSAKKAARRAARDAERRGRSKAGGSDEPVPYTVRGTVMRADR
jgi:hypothetical protein